MCASQCSQCVHVCYVIINVIVVTVVLWNKWNETKKKKPKKWHTEDDFSKSTHKILWYLAEFLLLLKIYIMSNLNGS